MPLLGEINTWKKPETDKRLDPDADTKYLIQEALIDRYIYDAVGKGPYKGVVLRVEEDFGIDGKNYDHPDNHPEGYMYTSDYTKPHGSENLPLLFRVRVRIPEVHAALPMPKCLPSPGSQAHPEDGIINLYPVFTSEKPGLKKPTQGQVVWVDFRDKENLESPIYKGLVDGVATLRLGCQDDEKKSGKGSFSRSRDCVGLAVGAPAGASFGAGCAKARQVGGDGTVRQTYFGEPTHDHLGVEMDEQAASQLPSAVGVDRCLEIGTSPPTTLGATNGGGTITEDGGIVDEDIDKWDIVVTTLVGETGAKF